MSRRATVERWLAEGLAFDAIFAGDDGSAVGALEALTPGERARAAVRAPTEQVGQEAVQQLVRLIETGKARPRTLLPTELVMRQSCGCGLP